MISGLLSPAFCRTFTTLQLILADDSTENSPVVPARVILDEVPQGLLVRLQKAFLDLYHVQLQPQTRVTV